RPRMGRRLIEQFGGPGAALRAGRSDLLTVDGMTEELADRMGDAEASPAAVERWLAYARSVQLKVVPFTSACYPPLLQQIHDPPAALFVRGDVDALTQEAVAIVGTRAATRYGAQVAERFAFGLASAGLVVVSGGALGVDTYVHRGAVGAGRTTVVLGCGLDIPYPAANQELFTRAAVSGAVVSEFALGVRPDTWRFPARNRIIS